MSISLAVKYRPKTFSDVVEQSATITILEQQLASGNIKNAYLFCGGAGTGKTTCARIFANEINKGVGSPIELDAASNNSVDDVRVIIQQSKTAALDSEYKVFIMDEVHALSSQAWQAMLKVLEEPPVKSIFIMCTTEKNKIPKTILSRVQQFNFQRISQNAIYSRLVEVIKYEYGTWLVKWQPAVEYIAKQAQGGMRDAITMLDKCLAYSTDLTIDNVIKALGMSDYTTMTELFDATVNSDWSAQIAIVNDVYMSGADLRQFIKDFTNFVLDYCKYNLTCKDTQYLNCPSSDEIISLFDNLMLEGFAGDSLLGSLIKLQADIKWDTNPKSRLEAWCITGE